MNVETCLIIKLSEVSCTKEGLFYGMKGKLTTPLSSNTNEDRKRVPAEKPPLSGSILLQSPFKLVLEHCWALTAWSQDL